MQNIGIIGCGVMGAQLSLACIAKGFDVKIIIRDNSDIEKCFSQINKHCNEILWQRYLGLNFILKPNQVKISTNLIHLTDRDIVIECISENYISKTKLMAELNVLNNKNLIVATNTSSLEISKIAMHYSYPENVVGFHIFNPFSVTKLIEISKTGKTSFDTLSLLEVFATRLGKTPIIISENPGLLVNRLLVPFWLDAIRELEKDEFTIEQIDSAIKLGCNHPIGPLELVDIIGIDVLVDFCNNVYEATGDLRFIAPKILLTKIRNEEFGRKSRKGFYTWISNVKSHD